MWLNGRWVSDWSSDPDTGASAQAQGRASVTYDIHGNPYENASAFDVEPLEPPSPYGAGASAIGDAGIHLDKYGEPVPPGSHLGISGVQEPDIAPYTPPPSIESHRPAPPPAAVPPPGARSARTIDDAITPHDPSATAPPQSAAEAALSSVMRHGVDMGRQSAPGVWSDDTNPLPRASVEMMKTGSERKYDGTPEYAGLRSRAFTIDDMPQKAHEDPRAYLERTHLADQNYEAGLARQHGYAAEDAARGQEQIGRLKTAETIEDMAPASPTGTLASRGISGATVGEERAALMREDERRQSGKIQAEEKDTIDRQEVQRYRDPIDRIDQQEDAEMDSIFNSPKYRVASPAEQKRVIMETRQRYERQRIEEWRIQSGARGRRLSDTHPELSPGVYQQREKNDMGGPVQDGSR